MDLTEQERDELRHLVQNARLALAQATVSPEDMDLPYVRNRLRLLDELKWKLGA